MGNAVPKDAPLRNVGLRQVVAGLVLAGLMAAFASAQAADKPSSRDLARYFEAVAFGSEFGGADAQRDFLIKWDGPIRLSVTGYDATEKTDANGAKTLEITKQPVRPAIHNRIDHHLNRALELTGVTREAPDPNHRPANFYIQLVPHIAMHAPFLAPNIAAENLKAMARDGVCYASVELKEGRIIEARIVVSTDLTAARMNACLLEEITQAFGLMNDSDLIQPSLFNQFSTSEVLHRTDMILLLALYDRQLKPGMLKGDAMPIATAILDQLNRSMPLGR